MSKKSPIKIVIEDEETSQDVLQEIKYDVFDLRYVILNGGKTHKEVLNTIIGRIINNLYKLEEYY